MLQSLRVWNFALLEEVAVEFGAGLNILTGETGAGKSILIDALGAILGQRISSDVIRNGCDALRVEAVFACEGDAALAALLAEQEIEYEDELIILRKVARTGKGSILVNGSHVTLTFLKKLAPHLVDIHGQNENLALLREDAQRSLLEGGDEELQKLLADYAEVYEGWREKTRLREERVEEIENIGERLDLLRWQEKEIAEAELSAGEDEELEAEIRRLSHSERLVENAGEASNLLSEDGEEGISVLSALSRITGALDEIARYDDGLSNAQTMIEEAYISLQEASYEVRDYLDAIDADPARLDRIQTRMDVIDRLKKKYGGSIAAVLERLAFIRSELESIDNYDTDMVQLDRDIAALCKRLGETAKALTVRRQEVGTVLSAEIERELEGLGMPKARFRIVVTPEEKYTSRGADSLSMLFSANVGEAEKPIEKIASGGELSRIALAIKSIVAARDTGGTSMVFDEIDTGIGGRTAQMVAERIAFVAHYKQVLCITHLPQIACMADAHLYIAKSVKGDSTVTQVEALSADERVREIARMASGDDVTEAALANAREMLAGAQQKKTAFQKKKAKK
ncbi:DNA repair protein RecN [Selenomonas sp. oral taxon 126]|uniref:DNA repair protein RecN n=1 Tax=Selenomonas sp. oral taxon 126 TaxID=712528 RepID=UPI000807881E|nr:DNA repair protein RecN [Selenomonas sp. oral taxon 126]ANR71183.1 DNA repair protein RecN [Selenomonas sp. oral taxon 126]